MSEKSKLRSCRSDSKSRNNAKRTLTHLYNERPAWLAHAHAALDAAVATAYGWPADFTNEEILARLLERNRGGGLKPPCPETIDRLPS